jgi:hypothetical protein
MLSRVARKSNVKKLSSKRSIKNTAIKISQKAIVKADIVLELLRLRIINRVNHYTNGVQSRLFFASMWLDKRRYGS